MRAKVKRLWEALKHHGRYCRQCKRAGGCIIPYCKNGIRLSQKLVEANGDLPAIKRHAHLLDLKWNR